MVNVNEWLMQRAPGGWGLSWIGLDGSGWNPMVADRPLGGLRMEKGGPGVKTDRGGDRAGVRKGA